MLSSCSFLLLTHRDGAPHSSVLLLSPVPCMVLPSAAFLLKIIKKFSSIRRPLPLTLVLWMWVLCTTPFSQLTNYISFPDFSFPFCLHSNISQICCFLIFLCSFHWVPLKTHSKQFLPGVHPQHLIITSATQACVFLHFLMLLGHFCWDSGKY